MSEVSTGLLRAICVRPLAEGSESRPSESRESRPVQTAWASNPLQRADWGASGEAARDDCRHGPDRDHKTDNRQRVNDRGQSIRFDAQCRQCRLALLLRMFESARPMREEACRPNPTMPRRAARCALARKLTREVVVRKSLRNAFRLFATRCESRWRALDQDRDEFARD